MKTPNIFANNLEEFGDSPAIITSNGETITYLRLAYLADSFSLNIPKDGNQLFLLAANNSLECIVAYLACLRSGIPVILTPHDKPDTRENINCLFHPTIIYKPEDGQFVMQHCPNIINTNQSFPADMSVLLSTSGTTGSAKLVKLSVANINANAKSIAEYLQLDASERAITSLPIYYSYGLSVINSHLSIGASIVLTDFSTIEDSFWHLFVDNNCTSFAGVPYTYELLKRSGFEERSLPCLRYLTQAGGKLPKELVQYYALLAKSRGWRFYVMYGQTEATARMSYLPPNKVLSHSDSIGVAIPQGSFDIIDEQGQLITAPHQSGELIYRGPNVMMGYASKADDLFSAEKLTELKTGDIAQRDEEGLYYISGRKSRFLKIYGNRIGLDEMESSLRSIGYVTICGGTDKHLVVLTLDPGKASEIEHVLFSKFKISSQYSSVEEVKNFPLLPSGKIDYRKLVEISESKAASDNNVNKSSFKPQWKNLTFLKRNKNKLTVLDIFQKVFMGKEITPESSFKALGGDSLNYVQIMILLEKNHGTLPDHWQNFSIKEIEGLKFVNNRQFDLIETNVILRATAISTVLINHTNAINPIYIAGGASFLLVLVGYSFARFQTELLLSGKVWSTIWGYLNKILIPYMGICIIFIILQKIVLKQAPEYDLLLMISNFYRLQVDAVFYLWFLQVLTQCLIILGLLFSIKKVREYCRDNLWIFSVTLLSIFSILCFTLDSFWNTQHLDFRVPHIYMPLFMVGWCVYLAKSSTQKWMLYCYSLLLFTAMYRQDMWQLANYIWLVLGITLLTFIPKLKIPKVIKPLVTEIASAAFYIYLTHIFVLHFIKPITDNPQLRFILLMLSCVLTTRAYFKAKELCRNFILPFEINIHKILHARDQTLR